MLQRHPLSLKDTAISINEGISSNKLEAFPYAAAVSALAEQAASLVSGLGFKHGDEGLSALALLEMYDVAILIGI